MTAATTPMLLVLRWARRIRSQLGAHIRRLEPRLVAVLIVAIGAALTLGVTEIGQGAAESSVRLELDLVAQTAIEEAHQRIDTTTEYAHQLSHTLQTDQVGDLGYQTMLANEPGVAWIHTSTPQPTTVDLMLPALSRPAIGPHDASLLPLSGNRMLITTARTVANGPAVAFAFDMTELIGSTLPSAAVGEIGWTLQRVDSQQRSKTPLTHSEFLLVGDTLFRLDVTPATGSELEAAAQPSLRVAGLGIVLTGWSAWAGSTLARRRRDAEAAEVERRSEAETWVGWAEQVLDQLDAAVIYTDLAGRVSYWNRHAETLYGWNSDEAVGQPIADLNVPVDGRTDAEDIIATVLSGGSWEGEFTVRRRDGTVFPARVADRLLCDLEGNPKGIVGLSVDISDERSVRDGLTDLVHSKDQFLASVSHELRTPLTAVVGFAELLHGSDSLPPAEVAAMHELIVIQAREVSDLVEDLLTSGRIDTDTITVRPEPVPVADLIRSVAQPWSTAAMSIEISDPDTLAVWADPLRLRQIVRNLIANTVRHGAPPVTVTVGNHRPDDRISIEIIDSGVGIPQDAIDTLFQPYSEATARHGQPASVGLGLYVSRKLAQMMDGDLHYDRNTGRTRFTVTLPSVPPSDSRTGASRRVA